jgi:hypothetical protein
MKERSEPSGSADVKKQESCEANYSLAQTARLAGVSERLLGLEAQRGRLRVVRIGRRVLVPRAEVLRLTGADE